MPGEDTGRSKMFRTRIASVFFNAVYFIVGKTWDISVFKSSVLEKIGANIVILSSM
jgi:hypothetical protein